MKLLYWNTKNLEQIEIFQEICNEQSPEILFFAETRSEFLAENIEKFSDLHYSKIENPGCDKIIILAKNNINIELGLQQKYFTHILINELNIISVHFPSQMNYHLKALRNHLFNFRNLLNTEIGNSSEKSIVIIGDLNVNPYESPMIDFDGFMASNSVRSRNEITNIGDTRETYYNPTWKLYADNEFPGTKKFPRPSATSFDIIEFHFLDQVLVSNKFKNNIVSESIFTLKHTQNYFLYNSKYNRVDYSDHLPLIYEFKINNNGMEKF